MSAYVKLSNIFQYLSHLGNIHALMIWDEAVMMPEGGADARADSMATLNSIMQKTVMNKKIKKLIEAAKQEDQLSNWEKANLLLMEKHYIRSASVPIKLNEKLIKASIQCEQAWRKLRAQNNWKSFSPYLKKLFKFVKEIAERQANALHMSPYDAQLDYYAPGFNQERIDKIFAGLKNTLPQLIQSIMKKQSSDEIKIPTGPFSMNAQRNLGIKAMQALQFDFTQGRLDVSHHPFCGGSPTDVRMTTRYTETEFISSLLGICHETGHALYEQGLPRDWIEQPVGRMQSMAMHESQSLLIEMEVCRSQEFYQFLLPDIQHMFGTQEALNVKNIYHYVNRVEPSLIRVDADEVTYPLHIILRYEIEKKLFNDELTISDLPDFWNESFIQYFGISTKGNYQDGVMQDVHWPSAAFGYFPAYTLGRLIAAQLFETFLQKHSDFMGQVEQGNFKALIDWLRENIHSKASLMPTDELLQTVTGKALDPQCFLRRVQKKYLEFLPSQGEG